MQRFVPCRSGAQVHPFVASGGQAPGALQSAWALHAVGPAGTSPSGPGPSCQPASITSGATISATSTNSGETSAVAVVPAASRTGRT